MRLGCSLGAPPQPADGSAATRGVPLIYLRAFPAQTQAAQGASLQVLALPGPSLCLFGVVITSRHHHRRCPLFLSAVGRAQLPGLRAAVGQSGNPVGLQWARWAPGSSSPTAQISPLPSGAVGSAPGPAAHSRRGMTLQEAAGAEGSRTQGSNTQRFLQSPFHC